MILKASQRAGAKQLAKHLLRTDENDHIEVHEVRGFMADDLVGALREAYAVSRGTKCSQYLFSVSLNPPKNETATVGAFERAIETIEERVGLSGQPRVIVFHEKDGRRHAHCVWSRIKADEMRAVNLPYFKRHLQDISRELYIEHGWTMPRGFVNSEERDPMNFTREEWQQAKRINRDPRSIKEVFQDCWATSDSLRAFQQALAARGYHLAQGDRRAFVAVDYLGEIYAVARWIGIKTKQVIERLGDPTALPPVNEVKAELREKLDAKIAGFRKEARTEFEGARTGLLAKKRSLVTHQRDERQDLLDLQAARFSEENRRRQARFRKGLRGVWDWFTGRTAEIRRQNEQEWEACRLRDEAERQALRDRQLGDRLSLHAQIKEHGKRLDKELARLQMGQSPSRQVSVNILHPKPRLEVRRHHRRSGMNPAP